MDQLPNKERMADIHPRSQVGLSFYNILYIGLDELKMSYFLLGEKHYHLYQPSGIRVEGLRMVH